MKHTHLIVLNKNEITDLFNWHINGYLLKSGKDIGYLVWYTVIELYKFVDIQVISRLSFVVIKVVRDKTSVAYWYTK